MERAPWFPFYNSDWLASEKVSLMSTAEVGGYTFLLCHLWNSPDCSLPNDPRTLAQLARLPESWEVAGRILRTCFIPHPKDAERLTNARLYFEWKKMKKRQADARKAGLSSGRSRHYASNSRSTSVEPSLNSSQSQSQSESESYSESLKTPNPDKKQKEKIKIPAPSGLARGIRLSVPVWTAYREAYLERYKVEPVRNARVNSCLSSLIQRVGVDAAPVLAAWYLTHNEFQYVKAQHATTLLLRDAEGLMTQMQRGSKVTRQEAQQAEAGDAIREQVKRVTALLKGEQS